MRKINEKRSLFSAILLMIFLTGNYYCLAEDQKIRDQNQEQITQEQRSDQAIVEELERLLKAEKDIPNTKIDVSAQNGIVMLSGMVATKLQESRIIEIAASIEGVSDVDNKQLNVKSSSGFFADSLITAKVKGRIKYLSLNKHIKENYDLHVETTDKIVHIFGNVGSEEDIELIKNAADNIVNVKKVKMNIKAR